MPHPGTERHHSCSSAAAKLLFAQFFMATVAPCVLKHAWGSSAPIGTLRDDILTMRYHP